MEHRLLFILGLFKDQSSRLHVVQYCALEAFGLLVDEVNFILVVLEPPFDPFYCQIYACRYHCNIRIEHCGREHRLCVPYVVDLVGSQ